MSLTIKNDPRDECDVDDFAADHQAYEESCLHDLLCVVRGLAEMGFTRARLAAEFGEAVAQVFAKPEPAPVRVGTDPVPF